MKGRFHCQRSIPIGVFAVLVATGGATTPPCGGSIDAVAGDDVRIGAPRTDALQVVLDYERQSGKYVAFVGWGGTSPGVSMNVSDDGSSWSETVSSQILNADIDITSVGPYVYSVFFTSTSSNFALVWRFFDTTFAVDGAYSFIAGASPSTSHILDVALESNQVDTDSEVYLAFIQDDGVLRFFWDHADDGNFTELSPPVANAAGGLDMQYNSASADHGLYLSYIGTDGAVHVWASYPWTEIGTFPGYSGSDMRTAVSASGDNVIVAFEALLGFGYGIIARTSDNAGASWSLYYVDAPSHAGDGDLGGADVTARGDQGFAAVYHQGLGTVPVYLRRNPEYHPGVWEPRIVVNNIDARVERSTNISWVPPHHYGIAYIGGGSSVPYFDLFDASFFSDGFETGDTSGWSSVVP